LRINKKILELKEVEAEKRYPKPTNIQNKTETQKLPGKAETRIK
jgi:hypothetical protein